MIKYIKEIFEDKFRNNFILLSIIIFAIEVIFRVISGFNIWGWTTLRIFLGVILISLLFSSLATLIKKRWIKNLICIIVVFILSLYAWLQLGFINYLGVYISFNTSSQFGAVKDYFWDYMASFKWFYYLIFIPFILYVIYLIIISKKQEYKPLIINLRTITIPFVLIIIGFLYYGTVTWDFMQNKYQTIPNEKLVRHASNPSLAINQFGTSVFAVLDVKSYLFPQPEKLEIYNGKVNYNENVSRSVSKDLEKIAKSETDSKYLNLHNYFLSQSITDYNEYTGMFADKNVIVLLLESVNDTIINEELFPNFYKMYSEGWHWNNSYSPRNSCATGNNEFSAMTGLYSLYNACTSNIYLDNTYSEAIFNVFNRGGYETNSMHDFSEWYYERPTIHTNMGSNEFYNAKKLNIKTATYYGEWPDDREFINKFLDINLEKEGKWMSWLTTVSSHQPYSSSSTYGDLYKNEFRQMGYSTAMSRYLSKLKVVDEALGILYERLEEAGELDNTVIVMLADHYPYGLNKKTVAETLKYPLEDYEIERTPFVIYNSEMEPKEFDEYTSYINLVPTIANLMGLEYDPRFYTGTDLLSEEYKSLVVFADGSWKNEKAYYNAATGNVKFYEDDAYTEEELREINELVSLKISMSNSAIKLNYFDHLEKKVKELKEKEKVEEAKEKETNKED